MQCHIIIIAGKKISSSVHELESPQLTHNITDRFSDGGDDGDGVHVQHRDHVRVGVGESGDGGGLVGAEGAGDGGDAGDGRCRVPRQRAGPHAEPGGASGQHEPINTAK